MFSKNEGYEAHIRDLAIKRRIAVNMIWGLGERICKDNWKKRWMLFEYLVRIVMEYGVEIWGWEEKKMLEKIIMDYVKWIFNLELCTPRYLIIRKLDLDKLKIE